MLKQVQHDSKEGEDQQVQGDNKKGQVRKWQKGEAKPVYGKVCRFARFLHKFCFYVESC